MNHGFLTCLGVSSVAIVVGLLAPASAAAQAVAKPAAAKSATAAEQWSVPRTPDGIPDLQGYWTNNSYTPLERPDGVTKEFYNKEELKEFEKKAQAFVVVPECADVHYDLAQFGLDRSQTRMTGNLRTSIITNPENGKLPPVTAQSRKRTAARAAERLKQGAQYDQVQNVPLGSRCVFTNAAVPMMPPAYNAAYQIVQAAGYVMILVENLHETRVIPTDGRPHVPAGMRSWLGDPKGHWEGDTLVVETTNFNDRVAIRGSSENLKITERFTRVSDAAIRYEFTMEDAATWERPWSGEMPFVKISGPIFEHACHEGNYGIANTLAAARREEKKAAEEAAAKEVGRHKE